MIQNLPWTYKIIICVIWDVLDFTVGRIPGIGTIFDMMGMVLAIIIWGPIGMTAFWEVGEITDQVDAQVPTLTVLGIMAYTLGQR